MTDPEVPPAEATSPGEAASDDAASEESTRLPDDGERGLYGISVAAELVGMGVQNLRLYEARGLLQPARTEGGTRRYSENDLEQLRRIGDLLAEGLNLAGISRVIDLEDENARLRRERDDTGPTT